MHFFEKKVLKNLRISEKSSTFAPAFESKALGAEKNRFLSAFEKEARSLQIVHHNPHNRGPRKF